MIPYPLLTRLGPSWAAERSNGALAALTPERDEARRWAEEELLKEKYRGADLSFWERISRAIGRFLNGVFDTVANTESLPFFVVVVLALAVGLFFVIRNLRKGSGDAFDAALFDSSIVGTQIDPAAERAEAERAAAHGQWSPAVRHRFIAIAGDLARRRIIDLEKSTTAFEVHEEAAAKIPLVAGQLEWASQLFDCVSFGEFEAERDDYVQISDIDHEISAAKPEKPRREPKAVV